MQADIVAINYYDLKIKSISFPIGCGQEKI